MGRVPTAGAVLSAGLTWVVLLRTANVNERPVGRME